ncbi:MAG: carboxypeptidase regulatory-like domain-containing protein [Candidatus Acidiferrales bacterium]
MHAKNLTTIFAFLLFPLLLGFALKPNPASAAPPAPVADSASAGTITGRVVLDGPAPAPRMIDMSGEPACRAAHPAPVAFPEVEMGDHGALADVVVYIKSGLASESFSAPETPVSLDQKGCMYSPHVVALMTNQTLLIANSDSTVHNVHLLSRLNRPWNKSEPSGVPPLRESFSLPELAMPLVCNVHPWMRGFIFVFANPYFQVTSRSGEFTLRNLPPGTYTLEAWQEKFGMLDQTVTLGPHESKSVSFVFHSSAR